MELTPVESSQIAAIGYNEDEFVCAIQFKDGAVYHYEDFPPEKYDDFKKAKSVGSFFGQQIKGNVSHPFKKVAEGSRTNGAAKTDEAVEVPQLPEKDEELPSRALAVQNEMRSLVITTPAEYESVAAKLKMVLEEKKHAQARVDRLRLPALRAYQATLELQRDVMTRYESGEDFCRKALAAYRTKEEAKRRESERLIAAERQRIANEEAIAESKRLQQEDAKSAEVRGEPEIAAQILAAPPLPIAARPVAPVVLQQQVPKVEGISGRKTWKWRVKEGQEHLVPRDYMKIDDTAINGVVRAMKGNTNITGIEVYSEESIAVRA